MIRDGEPRDQAVVADPEDGQRGPGRIGHKEARGDVATYLAWLSDENYGERRPASAIDARHDLKDSTR